MTETQTAPPRDWRFYLANAWRWQGGPKWSQEMRPFEVFLAQSNAVGFRRLAGIACTLAGDALYAYGAGPLLKRGMKGGRMGLNAKPWSVTRIAWLASGVLNDWRWMLNRWGAELARYNR